MRTARTTMIIALSVAAVALPTAAGACDTVDTVDTVEVTWLMPVPPDGWTSSPDVLGATWPQTLATGTECGNSWFQVDIYDNTLGTKRDTVNGLLSRRVLTSASEDSRVVKSWSFVEQQPCPTLEPVPIPTPTPTPTLEPVPIPTPTPTPGPSGGGTAATPPAIIAAPAAVPGAASPRFAG